MGRVVRFPFSRFFRRLKRRWRSPPSAEPLYFSRLRHLSDDRWRAALAESPEEAARWVYAAAAYGDADAQVVWGQMLLDGHGTARDPQGACRWFRIAADAGNADGLNMLGRCHELGWGIAPDSAEAARLFRMAAGRGHAWAQFNLASLMLQGEGLPRDPNGALSLLVRSARQGNPKAMSLIGRYRELGWVGPVRMASAARWYRRAAERGCFRGCFDTGRFLMLEGRVAEAAHWCRRSLDAAPPAFCREAAPLLAGRPEPELKALARHALERAGA